MTGNNTRSAQRITESLTTDPYLLHRITEISSDDCTQECRQGRACECEDDDLDGGMAMLGRVGLYLIAMALIGGVYVVWVSL